MSEIVLGYELEWFDSVSGTTMPLYLKFFLDNNTIEILKENAIFLKRIYYPSVQLSDLFLGNSFTIYNRLLVIKAYANVSTARYMAARECHYLCILSCKSLNLIGKVICTVNKHKFVIGKVKTANTSFCSDTDNINISPGDVILEIVGISNNKINIMDQLENIFTSIRVMPMSFEKIEMLFSYFTGLDEYPDYCTLCIIKPHAIKSMISGNIIQSITEAGFKISALLGLTFTYQMCEEMFDVYKTIYPTYSQSLEEISSGMSLCVLISGDVEVVEQFRNFTGPLNPELGRTLRPLSLRAVYGKDNILNAVHCTDLADDGELECKYIFSALSSL